MKKLRGPNQLNSANGAGTSLEAEAAQEPIQSGRHSPTDLLLKTDQCFRAFNLQEQLGPKVVAPRHPRDWQDQVMQQCTLGKSFQGTSPKNTKKIVI